MSKKIRNADGVKSSLRAQLEEGRRQTDAIFGIVNQQAFYDRPIAERHRIIFYLGHLEAFDWNMVCGTSFQMRPLHEEFERLFAFGIDPVDGELPQDRPSDWPSVDAVRRYNLQARQAVDRCLEGADFSQSDQPHIKNGLIFSVAIEHRLMHIETLRYMLHWLPLEMKRQPQTPLPDFQPQPASRQARVPRGQAELGILRDDESTFGWDNEYERHVVDVPEFEIDVYKVSNAEFLEFVEAGGYQQRSLWTDDAWKWISSQDIRHPKFWVKRAEGWRYRGMFAEVQLPLSWPVYVSHAEASAYARWRNKSLPAEAEFHRAAFGVESIEPDAGERLSVPLKGNFGLQRWEPIPVHSRDQTVSSFGVVGMIGNGWEWTSSLFAPFPGFERFSFYPGYSADFFDNKHFVVKGASPSTPFRLTRPSFRNWYQPHYPYIYAGFRCVER